MECEEQQPLILIADDCPANRRLCERLLQRDGFAIEHAQNGAEAVEKARSLSPHVIIMDIMMPVLDGLGATRLLRAHPATSTIPIIVASAKTDEESLTAGLVAGADEYVFKPVRGREFRLRVRSMVRLRQAVLQSERANESLRLRTDLLGELNRFCEAVLVDSNVEAACQHIVETASELMQSNRVSLLVLDKSHEFFRIAHAVGFNGIDWRQIKVPVDSPVAGRVFRSSDEIVAWGEYAEATSDGQSGSDPFASLPIVSAALRSREGPLGVLNITDRKDGNAYREDDVQALRQFAHLSALALNNVLNRQKLDETRDSIIFSLAQLSEYRHAETGRHLERVRELSTILAQRLAEDPRVPEQLDEQFIIDIRRAAPLHDIGKVAIPDSILLKKGNLTREEFETMKSHSTIGAYTLESVITSGHESTFLQMAMDIARYHHERYDGTGYPEGLAGDHIPICARIVCLADTYDAIRMKREYKPARSHEEATAEIVKASGTQFDPRIVDAYLASETAFRDIYSLWSEDIDLSPGGTGPAKDVEACASSAS